MADNNIKIVGILAAAVLVVGLLWQTGNEKRAEISGVTDKINTANFDEYRLPFSSTVIRNMQQREKDNTMMNELYGGVPPVTITDITQYITGQMPYLQNLGRFR